MTYLALYYLHIAAVIFSGGFFLIRGFWMLKESPLLEAKFTRIAPHINDTILLGAAVGLAAMTQQYPLTHDWLTVKIVALLAYIVLGVFSLRRSTKAVRTVCFVAAIATFAFMISVALTRQPLGVFQGLIS
ncbi:MAG: SirB2 family protein [Gammaproteobacteria bacterium]|jgi:uncharacterized membrane protein SirB2|nr:SirB2 family protein [Gammaproteobacteria bacterium]MBT4491878.1 SirB2 family protein [Gammaproteobacteria bacterium]MBT7370408.1 SirB2 family protein [Gammaproteobacteria bacterium]